MSVNGGAVRRGMLTGLHSQYKETFTSPVSSFIAANTGRDCGIGALDGERNDGAARRRLHRMERRCLIARLRKPRDKRML